MRTLTCEICGQSFEAARRDARICKRDDCRKQYFRDNWRKNKLNGWTPQTLECDICGTEFTQIRSKQLRCSKSCTRKAANRARERNPEQHRKMKEANLLKTYGITLAEYNYLMVMQSDRCAFCLTDDKGGHRYWSVDHDHETGKVRQLLCKNCNVGFGHFKEDPIALERAAAFARGEALDV